MTNNKKNNYEYKQINYFNIYNKDMKKYIALGFFDGIHLGHQALLNWCVKKAKAAGAISTVILFDQHPEKVINKLNNYSLLTTLAEQIEKIRKKGIQKIIIFKFDENFSKIKAEEFIIEVLLKKFKMGAVFTGHDYHFGYQKKGDIALLKKLGEIYNFESYVMNSITMNSNQKISSTVIKDYLKNGDIEKANKLLGYHYQMRGKVIHGDNRGNSVLSFPTANLEIEPEKLLPKNGVYLGFTHYKGRKYNSLINIGFKPTFKLEKWNISVEVYIFNFRNDIYNKKVIISFIKRIRDEKKYNNARDLISQIKQDKLIADNYFNEHE
jgi:riboflavin kinase/FMN adenylyltransferase